MNAIRALRYVWGDGGHGEPELAEDQMQSTIVVSVHLEIKRESTYNERSMH